MAMITAIDEYPKSPEATKNPVFLNEKTPL